MHAAVDWYKTFFTGLVVEGWLNAMPVEVTEREADFIRQTLKVAPPAKLLDVPCGGGRHAITLAAAGYHVTGVDISPAFLDAARAMDQKHAVAWEQRDMTDLPWKKAFDGAYCFGNSFGYLTDADNARYLHAVAQTLKPGARFVLDCPVVAEVLFTIFKEQSSHQLGDVLFERNGRYDPAAGRIVVEHTCTRGDQSERRVMSQRVYTYRELCGLLTDAGFTNVQGYGGFDDEPFKLGAKRLLLIAQAPG